MLHSALFVAANPPEKKEQWEEFSRQIDLHLENHLAATICLAENAWLLDFQKSPASLAWLVAIADNLEIRYGILSFERAPEWLPAGFDPKTIPARNVQP